MYERIDLTTRSAMTTTTIRFSMIGFTTATIRFSFGVTTFATTSTLFGIITVYRLNGSVILIIIINIKINMSKELLKEDHAHLRLAIAWAKPTRVSRQY